MENFIFQWEALCIEMHSIHLSLKKIVLNLAFYFGALKKETDKHTKASWLSLFHCRIKNGFTRSSPVNHNLVTWKIVGLV